MGKSKIRKVKADKLSLAVSEGVCIVTEKLFSFGYDDESAIGIAAVAQRLSACGHRVTLVWTPDPGSIDSKKIIELKEYYYQYFLITLEVLTEVPDLHTWLGWHEIKSAAVYYYLKERHFGVVYFSLEGGLGYYSLLSKENGQFWPRPQLMVIAQTSTDWLAESDRRFLATFQQVSASFMEKICVELADSLICVSKSMADWMKRREWRLPESVAFLPPCLPSELSLPVTEGEPSVLTGGTGELLVLAGPSFRDGLTLVCDAIDELGKLDVPKLKVTAFGPFGQILGEHTGGMLVRRARRWPFFLQLFPWMSHRQALEHARATGAVAVVPAHASATGYWARSCLEAGIPVVATAVGANSELPENAAEILLSQPSARELAATIAQAINRPLEKQLLADRARSWEAWQQSFEKAGREVRPAPPARFSAQKQPLVSIVMVHHDRPQYLLQAIDAVRHQTYRNFELILVDDGSRLPASKLLLDRLENEFKTRRWKLVRQENKYLGAARNAGVRASRGDFILFVDDDNALFPDAVLKFVSAMKNAGADICTAFQKVFYGDRVPASTDQGKIRYIPLGGSLDLGFLWDSFGDANAMVRRTVFDKIGYQVEDYGYTAHDWEFFARAALSGLKLRVIPDPLYWYRSSTEGMYRTSHWYDNRLPVIETYKKNGFKGVEHLYHLAMTGFSGTWESLSFRENLRRSESDKQFLALTKHDANSPEAIELLASAAAAEGRPDTALTLLGKTSQESFRSRTVASLGIEPYADRAMRELTLGLAHEIAIEDLQLREFVASRARGGGESPLIYYERPDRLYLEASAGDLSIAVLHAGCPASTVGLRLTALLDQELAAQAEVLVACPIFCTRRSERLLHVGSLVERGWFGRDGIGRASCRERV